MSPTSYQTAPPRNGKLIVPRRKERQNPLPKLTVHVHMTARASYLVGISLFAVGLGLLIAGLVFAYRYVIGLPIPSFLVGLAQDAAREGEGGPFLIGLPCAFIATLGFVIASRNET